MKKTLLSFIAFLFIASLSAQTDSQTQKLIDEYIHNNLSIKTEPIDLPAYSKVFVGKFYKTAIDFIETGTGATSCTEDNCVNVNGTSVSMPEGMHTDLECPVLLSLIKKDFLLKDENAAKLFEGALNAIYPVKKEELPNVKHMKKGAQWIFLREKFFDDYTAFILTTGANGAVTKIEIKLGYTVQ